MKRNLIGYDARMLGQRLNVHPAAEGVPEGRCGGSVTSPVKSKRTAASPSSTMGKMREPDSQAFGSERCPNQYICKSMVEELQEK